MLKAQRGKCAVCGAKPEEVLAVDHDHGHCPGRYGCEECVRGLVCRKCNMGMGLFEDNPVRLAQAVLYLSRYAAHQ